jgi:hypothetical protein
VKALPGSSELVDRPRNRSRPRESPAPEPTTTNRPDWLVIPEGPPRIPECPRRRRVPRGGDLGKLWCSWACELQMSCTEGRNALQMRSGAGSALIVDRRDKLVVGYGRNPAPTSSVHRHHALADPSATERRQPGSSSSILAPPPGLSPAVTRPWWAWAMARTIARPSPVPPEARSRAASVR